MRITDVRERTVSLADPMRNAAISFDDMTASAVAVVTDVVRDGAPVIGYGFSSVGRYGHGGLLRERFIPRLETADPGALLDASGNLDPLRAWDVLMRNEKPGGHGERSGAVGVLDMALWDAAAKIAGVPLYRLLADRFNGGAADDRVFVYASGGPLPSRRRTRPARRRDPIDPRPRVHDDQDQGGRAGHRRRPARESRPRSRPLGPPAPWPST